MLGLAWALRDLQPDTIERYSLGAGAVSEGVIPGDPYAQIPHPGAIEALAQQLVNGDAPPKQQEK